MACKFRIPVTQYGGYAVIDTSDQTLLRGAQWWGPFETVDEAFNKVEDMAQTYAVDYSANVSNPDAKAIIAEFDGR